MAQDLKIVSTVDAVTDAIAKLIFTSEFTPGQIIKEVDLAKRFGVSRHTIREAIAGLLKSGLLIKKANHGVFVKQMMLDDIMEIYHIRSMFECEAIKTIITSGTISESIYEALAVVEGIEACQQDTWLDFASADVDFHAAIVKAANNGRMSLLYETIASEVRLCMFQSKEIISMEEHNRYSHRMIVDAMISGDVDEAIRITKAHIDYGALRFTEGFSQLNS